VNLKKQLKKEPNINKSQDAFICCLQETQFRPKDICRLKVRGWKNIYHAKGCPVKPG